MLNKYFPILSSCLVLSHFVKDSNNIQCEHSCPFETTKFFKIQENIWQNQKTIKIKSV